MDRRRGARITFGVLTVALLVWWLWPDPPSAGPPPLLPVGGGVPATPDTPQPTITTGPIPGADPADPDATAEVPTPFPPLGPPPDGVPGGQALCDLDPPLTAASGHLVVGDPDEIPYDGRQVQVVAGRARLPFVSGTGHGTLAIEGYDPVAVTWIGGAEGVAARCDPDPVPLSAAASWITGHVAHAEGAPSGQVFVEGCGNQASTDADGAYAMTAVPGRCTLGAFRRDGLLVARSQAAEVEPVAGGEIVVDFALPELPRAGLGIVIEGTPAGMRILDVLDGTAASDIGLTEGDLVIEVDGTPTVGVTLEDFVDLVVGPVGTDVQIVVDHGEGPPEVLTLDRRQLGG